jgi:beta-phosphoglucomutase
MEKAVLFDMDGVLVDSEPVINEAAILGLNEYGIKPEPEDFLPFVGAGEDRYIGGVAEKHGLVYKVEMKHRVYQIYLEIVDEKIKIFDGVHELLKFLKESNVKIALASSADIIKIEANLKAACIDKSIFDAIVSGEDVVNKKPSPDIYLYAAKKIGVIPENCIVIEDALNGIQAAKAAGMKCVAVATSFSEDQLSNEKPDRICNNIKGVRSALSEI